MCHFATLEVLFSSLFMAERERHRFPQVLPPIYEEDLLLAHHEVQPLIGDDREAFTERVFEELARPEGDPELRTGIRMYQGLRKSIFKDKPDPGPESDFGAAYFASILGTLEEIGYSFPKISKEVAIAPFAPVIGTMLRARFDYGRKKGFTRTDARRQGKPLSELQDWQRTVEKAEEVFDIKDLMYYQIFSENPDLRSIFYRLSFPAMLGAGDVYNLKRRQYLLNQRQ